MCKGKYNYSIKSFGNELSESISYLIGTENTHKNLKICFIDRNKLQRVK